ncbi:hypothetical protein E3E12_02475 [Formicincola oecophyllae]|uniref:Uncharacterized protein n=1 Tax=Formicincola oecophyllae TaxID=2558361 RepID=A0A4Y6U786_9PROT|nr:TerB N-terminal domain-containing protein [Formicincola oecophyllae]QDH13253.1 hypothetical protein E3E12_02475 [Formicincola oecophyllae]
MNGPKVLSNPYPVWFGAGEEVSIAGRHLAGGMVHIAHTVSASTPHAAAVINTALPIAPPAQTQKPEGTPPPPVGYWPDWRQLTPYQRGAWLDWLAGGRSDPKADIGHVFLFFCGLERRLLLGTPSLAECQALCAEVRRLQALYGSHGAFMRYANALLGVVAYSRGPQAVLGPSSSLPLESALARAPDGLPGAGMALNVEEALEALHAHPSFRQKLWVLGAQNSLPSQLFRNSFEQVFASEAGKLHRLPALPGHDQRGRDILYKGATRGLLLTLTPHKAGATMSPPADWTVLLQWGERALAPLHPVVRSLRPHTKGGALATGASLELLNLLTGCISPELRQEIGRVPLEWLQNVRQKTMAPCVEPLSLPLAELGRHVLSTRDQGKGEGASGQRFAKRHRQRLETTLLKHGLLMVPDFHEHPAPLKGAEIVYLYQGADGPIPLSPLLRAGLMTWGFFHPQQGLPTNLEITKTQAILAHFSPPLPPAAFKAWLAWWQTHPPSWPKLLKTCLEAPPLDATALSEAALQAALFASTPGESLSPTVLRKLEALHERLGVPQTVMWSRLHELSCNQSAGAPKPITITMEGPQRSCPPSSLSGKAVPLPAPDGACPLPTPSHIKSSAEQLTAIRQETARATAMLEGVFTEGVDNPPNTLLEVGAASGKGERVPAVLEGLDGPHAAMAMGLLEKSLWPSEALAQLASTWGLLADGALETINEWAWDKHGMALLEEHATLPGCYELNPDIHLPTN